MAAIAPWMRRFTLADAMAVVAATAAGIGVSSAIQGSPGPYMPPIAGRLPHPLDPLKPVFAPLTRGMVVWGPVLVSWTLIVPVLRLRRPRPVKRRLFAPPGIAACFVATTLVVFEIIRYAARTTAHGVVVRANGDLSSFGPPHLIDAAWRGSTSISIGFGVAALWIWLASSGRWDAEPHWIDRIGRLIGVLWVVLIPFRLYFEDYILVI